MNFKTGDKVIVIAGKDKGKIGNITKILSKDNKVIVEGVNIVKKHIKPRGNESGSIVEIESPLHSSNVMIVDPKTNKRTRIGHKINKDGKKIRVTKDSNSAID